LSGGGTIDVPATASVSTGAVSGIGGLTKTGSGRLSLASGSTYSGSTTISGGTLSGNTIAAPGSNSSFGRGSSFTISNNATLEYTGGTVGVDQDFILGTGGGRISITNAVALVPINKPITGTSLTKAGSGILRFDAANTYTGATTIEAGELRLNIANVVPDTSAVTVNSGATFNLGGLNETVGSLAGSGLVTNIGALTTGGNNTSTSFSGSISGSGTLAKSGTGTLTLFGPNLYTGGRTIGGGKLLANNTTGSGTGTGQVTVNADGTLGGTGSVSGPVTVNNGGTLAPGASIESFGVGNLTFNAGSTFAVEMNSSTALNVAADLVYTSASLTIVDGALLSITNATPNQVLPIDTKFTLISYRSGGWNGGTFAGLADDAEFHIGPHVYKINYNDTTPGSNFTADAGLGRSYVTISAVPEAGTIAMFGIAITFAGVATKLESRRRRLRREQHEMAHSDYLW
jgi:autotransporter-associated beta strand protein